MQIARIKNLFSIPNVPEINSEVRLAARVAKLQQRNDAFAAWADAVTDAEGASGCEALRGVYDAACLDALESRCLWVGTPAHLVVADKPALTALSATARKLEVAHLAALRDCVIATMSDLKIARQTAYMATLGSRPDPVEVAATQAEVDVRKSTADYVGAAFCRASMFADADARESFERPAAPSYPRPPHGILKLRAPTPAPKKSLRWADDLVAPPVTAVSGDESDACTARASTVRMP